MVEASYLRRIEGSASEKYAQGHRTLPDHTRKWHIQSRPLVTEQGFPESYISNKKTFHDAAPSMHNAHQCNSVLG